ncbi:MAG: SMP-30/gluconolactonase/LRE family protein [Pseudomonadota bacterium]
MQATLFDDHKAGLGESPLWSVREQALYWVDVLAGVIHRRSLAGDRHSWAFGEEVGAIALRRKGGLVLAARSGFYAFEPDTGTRTLLADPEPDLPRNRLNDGKVDRQGRFWSGSLQEGDYAPVGNLWSIDSRHQVRKWASELTIPNALCWSPDGTRMYFADSPSGQIDVFDVDTASGAATGRRMFAKIPDARGLPDGATTDRLGRLWCANIDGARLLCFRDDGTLQNEVALPASRPTSCTFGGPALDILFVTTASRRLSEQQLAEQPWAGCVLAIRVDGTGQAEPEYIELD